MRARRMTPRFSHSPAFASHGWIAFCISGLDEELLKKEKAIDKIEATAEAKYEATKEAAAGTTGVTAKKVKERAEKERTAEMGKAHKMTDAMQAERDRRMAGYMADAAKYKLAAQDKEKELLARMVNKHWKGKAREQMEERVCGPDALPLTAVECKNLVVKYPTATPFEGAYLYLVAFYRLTNVRGGKDRKITMEMMTDVLHPDCLMEKNDELKIRKHTLDAMTKVHLDIIAASYFEGANPDLKHPLNEYKINTDAMKVNFASTQKSYENVEGAEFKVEIFSHGVEALQNPHRVLELKYHEGRWKARGISRILQAVVRPFAMKGADNDDDFFREKAYREGWKLGTAKRQEHVLADGAAGTEYVAPRSDISLSYEKVDVIGAAMAKKKAAYMAHIATLPPAKQQEISDSRKAKRAAKAKAATKALAASGDVESDESDYDIPE